MATAVLEMTVLAVVVASLAGSLPWLVALPRVFRFPR
jgi:hypothetical protein